jgi:hypothetical protein
MDTNTFVKELCGIMDDLAKGTHVLGTKRRPHPGKHSVNEAEMGDWDALYFAQEYGGHMLSVAQAPDALNLTSIVGKDCEGNFVHLVLNPVETDLMIEALQEVRRRQATPAEPSPHA